jgi:hypothetical protein
MKTAELQVEHVLIGAVVLATGLVPWLPELSRWVEHHDNALNLVAGAVSLGAAYLLGIMFDRLADTLTEPLERHQRLRFGLRQRFIIARVKWTDDPQQPWPDLFPEDRYRMQALRDEEAVVAWVDYQRLRVRLSRALAIYLPVLTWCAVVGLGRYRDIGPPHVQLAWIGWLVIGLTWVVTLWLESRAPDQHSSEWNTLFTAPRTDRPAAIAYAKACGFDDAGDVEDRKRKQRITLARAFAYNPAFVGAMVLIGMTVALAAVLDSNRQPALEMLPAAILGGALSVLAMRTWWRISYTYRTYLKQASDSRAGP